MATEIAAKGDLIVGTGAATFDNLAVGTNGMTIVADSTASTGLKWATASSALTPIGTTQTFTTSSAVNVNNVFSATYKNYRVIINITASGATSVDQQLRWRVSGTDASSNDYYYSTVVANESTVTGNGASAATQFMLSNNGTIGVIYIILDIFQPFVATRTDLLWQAVNVNATYRGAAANLNGATSYDGFSIIPASSNITGSVTCYGYSN
jgi:hypothetical protein